jgi:hypothetical protein
VSVTVRREMDSDSLCLGVVRETGTGVSVTPTRLTLTESELSVLT